MGDAKESIKDVHPGWRELLDSPNLPTLRHKLLVGMIEETGGDENHPFAGLIETLGTLIEAYEDQHVPVREGGPIEALRALMLEHGLSQADLREIGSHGGLCCTSCQTRP